MFCCGEAVLHQIRMLYLSDRSSERTTAFTLADYAWERGVVFCKGRMELPEGEEIVNQCPGG